MGWKNVFNFILELNFLCDVEGVFYLSGEGIIFLLADLIKDDNIIIEHFKYLQENVCLVIDFGPD